MGMDEKEVLTQYESLLRTIWERENLKSLTDFDDVKFDGTNALDFANRLSKTRNALKARDVSMDMLIHDLIYSVSSDARFSLSCAYLYFPHANNFMNDVVPFGNSGVHMPTYFRGLGDKRFFFFVNTTFEKLYMFWDRIAALLNESLELGIDENRVYFPKIVERLRDARFDGSQNADWLKNYHDNEYSTILNYLRRLIVHHRQKDTYFFMSWIDASRSYENNPALLDELQREKEALLPKLKTQLELTLVGFEKAVSLISEKGIHEQQ